MTIEALTQLDFHPASQGDSLRRKLSAVRGLRLNGAYRGRFSLGTTKATVTLDGDGGLRLTTDVGAAIGVRAALDANAGFPGNLRFMIGVDNLQLVADVCLGNGDNVANSLGYVTRGLQSVVARRMSRWGINDHPLDPGDVQTVLKTVPWDEQAIVELGDAWELRPRFEGEAVPVKLTVEGSEVHLRRMVVRKYQDHCWVDAVATQALRFNALLKHARLASAGGQIVADARIHRTVLNGDSLAMAARAVAVAERRVCNVLQILATHEEIAEQYSAMLNNR